MKQNLSRQLLAAFFIVAGILHFAYSKNYMQIIPPWLPWHWSLVIASGLFEIAGGASLLWPRMRSWARYGLIILCVAVLPANVQMLLNAQSENASAFWLAMLWIRLPLQCLLMAWIWTATRRTQK